MQKGGPGSWDKCTRSIKSQIFLVTVGHTICCSPSYLVFGNLYMKNAKNWNRNFNPLLIGTFLATATFRGTEDTKKTNNLQVLLGKISNISFRSPPPTRPCLCLSFFILSSFFVLLSPFSSFFRLFRLFRLSSSLDFGRKKTRHGLGEGAYNCTLKYSSGCALSISLQVTYHKSLPIFQDPQFLFRDFLLRFYGGRGVH